MTTFTAEQKTQLAKLMATENLTVQHQKIRTARFDPINRILYLPIWQNMTGVMYDLLTGHEVGHALYTPADGWHDAVMDKSKPKNYKNFLNVVEDARIEKKVKRKYPGLSTAFKQAYQQLVDRDFFGIKGRDVNDLSFVDRLNLYSKSQWSANWIKFSSEESALIAKVQIAETWDDVVRATDEIFEYSKTEQMEMQMADFEALSQIDDDLEDGYDLDDSYEDYDYEEIEDMDSESEKADSSDSTEEETDEEADSETNSENAGDEEDSETDNVGNSFNRWKESQQSWKDQFSPSCETDETFRKNETGLLDEKCKDYLYVNIPKPNLKNIVTPAKVVQNNLTKFFKENEWRIPPGIGMKLLSDFKNKNERYVGLLAKEFEMRKAAKAFSKSKLSNTGDIDISKLAGYKIDENIFRKVMLTPKGKSHGLILLLDKSGSMSNNMAGSIEQILVLTMFCRKVNIPFAVYGFGDDTDAHLVDSGFDPNDYESRIKYKTPEFFEKKVNDLDVGGVFLREYLNSKMTNAEYTAALKNMVMLKNSFEGNRYESPKIPRPTGESLGNTPLTQAIIATAELMKEFKRNNNLDITNLVIVHDGDADTINDYLTEYETKDIFGNKIKKLGGCYFNFYDTNILLTDTQNKFQYKLSKERDSVNEAIIQWFTKVTGSKVFGFFIVSSNRGNIKNAIQNRFTFEDGRTIQEIRNANYSDWYTKTSELNKKFRSEKMLISKRKGFDSFFLISGGNELSTEDDELEVDGKFTARKLASAFTKLNKKKAVNRVLVSKFIQGIAA